MILCDGIYGLGAYGIDSVHNREPERSRVTIWYEINHLLIVYMLVVLITS